MDDESPPSAGPAASHRSSNSSSSSSSSSDGSAEDNSIDRFLPPAAEGTVTSPDHPPEAEASEAFEGGGRDSEGETSGGGTSGGGGLEDWGDDRWLTVGRRLGASPVQLSIMRLMLVEELSNESIAHRLGRSRMAVDTQIKRLYKKVGVKTRVGLVKRVYQSVMQVLPGVIE